MEKEEIIKYWKDTSEDVNLKNILKIVKNFSELLKKDFNIKGVYLFGSYVNGKYNEDSDIDVAVVADNFSGDLIDDTFKLMKIRRNIDSRIEPHPFLLKDFNETNPFFKEIMNNNIKVA